MKKYKKCRKCKCKKCKECRGISVESVENVSVESLESVDYPRFPIKRFLLISDAWDLDFGIFRINSEPCSNFHLKRRTFQCFYFRTFFVSIPSFSGSKTMNFRFPRIIFDIYGNCQLNRSIFNFSSPDLLFEKPQLTALSIVTSLN